MAVTAGVSQETLAAQNPAYRSASLFIFSGHPGERRDPLAEGRACPWWIPAFAGMTGMLLA